MQKRYILFLILVPILIPLLLQFFIFNNSIPSNTSNDGWASFLGSYLGAIIGAITTLIAVSLQLNHSNIQRKQDEIINIRPYLYLNVITNVSSGNITEIHGTLKNIGLHSACDIYIYEDDQDHPEQTNPWTSHLSIPANSSADIKKNFDFKKTVNYKFAYYDLKSNRYEQEFRYDTEANTFYSLEPKLDKMKN